MAIAQKKKVKAKVNFNSHFREVNNSRHRYRILKGSAGSGKSVNIAQDYILKLSDPKYKGANLLCIRKIDLSNRKSTFSELTGAINRIFGEYASRYWYINESNMILRSKVTGNEIAFKGVQHEKDREKLKSFNFAKGKLTWIWVNNSAHIKPL